jgi:hypothetical protein
MRRPRLLVALLALGAAALLVALNARARVEADSVYTKTQTYSGALRYLRVDLGYEVVEKDPDAAYLIFRYAPTGPSKDAPTGTLEVIETDTRVKVFVQIPRMPEYHERMLRDGLMKKLREEYGVPAPRVPSAKEKPEPDAGSKADAGEKD